MGRYKFKNDGETLQLYDNEKEVLISPMNLDGVELILNLQDEMIKTLEKKVEVQKELETVLKEEISRLEYAVNGKNS